MDFFLIGEKLGHSWSPWIHRHLGYDYGLEEIKPNDLDDFMKRKDFKGINITIPYKKAVMPYCHTLSPSAQKIGCVNTIIRDENGNLHGHNTDYDGSLFMAKATKISFKNKKILLLGDGATSLTLKTVLEDQGAEEIIQISRKGPIGYPDAPTYDNAQVIINTTPVGMYPKTGEKLVDLRGFPNCQCVLDVIYHPLKTALILQAEDLGIRSFGGLPMLIHQGVKAGEIFLGKTLGAKEMSWQLLEKMEKDMQNIVLVGMPGSGKTTVGREIANLLNRPFVDIDEEIEKKEGRSIPDIFKMKGEGYFREIESSVCYEVGMKKALVIATGGGAVLRERNIHSLRQNGYVYYLKRDIHLLPKQGRPLSLGASSLETMAKEREGFYRRSSDEVIVCEQSPKVIAKEICQKWQKKGRINPGL